MKHRNYIKNPVKISTLLPKVLKPLKNRDGVILLEIKLNWKEIIGSKLSSLCFASSLNTINNKNILIIVSEKKNILEISYSSEEIKEKINSFFNGTIIHQIKFKKVLQF